jgi:site-specific recombinase XerD
MAGVTDKTLFSLLRDFLKVYLTDIKRYSRHTIRAYQKSLELLFDFVKAQKQVELYQVTFKMINGEMLTEFLDHLENTRGNSVSTRNHRLHCIRAFYIYAAKMEITTVAYWEEIKNVDSAEAPKKPVGHMSEIAVKAVFGQPDTSTRKGLRDMFLMFFLYQTGARIQELLDIRLRDIHWGTVPTVMLHGKGSKSRSVPLRENAVEHLKKYVRIFHSNEDGYSGQYLFYTVREGDRKRMTEDNARRLIRSYGVSARGSCVEVPEKVHPHLFRHSRAMHLYQSGVDLTLVSQWLGHSKLETTYIYAFADTELKRKAIEKAIPDDSPLKKYLNAERYNVTDEDTLKQLYGLK